MEALNPTFLNAVRHVPRLLRIQLLSKLTSQYVTQDKTSLVNEELVESQSESHLGSTFAPSIGIHMKRDAMTQMIAYEPSIERFYGALLFVDISGFTALSQKLDVESLKTHINDYFSKMLNVIDKWDGDVVKFAGDALYIIWQVEYESLQHKEATDVPRGSKNNSSRSGRTAMKLMSDSKFHAAAKVAVEKAVACALEINAFCCNHRVNLTSSSDSAQSRWSKLFNSLPVILSEQTATIKTTMVAPSLPAKAVTADEKIAYLNVHSGVGFGLMAGADVGSRDRWEYFLLGEPISQVAGAEGLAETGDVVVSSIAHGLIHQYHVNTDLMADSEETLSCGCSRLPFDFCRISKVAQGPVVHRRPSTRRSKSKAKLDDFVLSQALADSEEKLQEYYNEEVQRAFTAVQNTLKKMVYGFWSTNRVNLKRYLNVDEDVFYPDESKLFTRKIDKFVIDFISLKVRPSFAAWVHKCLIDDLVKHTHEAARARFDLFNLHRVGGFEQFLKEQFLSQEAVVVASSPSSGGRSSFLQRMASATFGMDLSTVQEDEKEIYLDDSGCSERNMSSGHNMSFNDNAAGNSSTVRRKPSLGGKQRSFTLSQKNMLQNASMSAEMRTVIVMFVKIDGLDSEISVDDNPDPTLVLGSNLACFARFNFLLRSTVEHAADMELLVKLQRCMEILVEAFATNGGQMRQFIIDDKGTVAIGTFGLRGSMAGDNAAAAVETAKTIVIELQQLGLTASIGITSGKAYCGIVGSPLRHEYAVMGPSVNLSARLMCKAPACSVMTDNDTKSKDRTHSFEALNEITAKGYTLPVMTFKPVFNDLLGKQSSISDVALQALSPTCLKGRMPSQSNFVRSSIGDASFFDSISVKAGGNNTGGGQVSKRNSMRNSMTRNSMTNEVARQQRSTKVSGLFKNVMQTEFYVHRKKGSRDFVAINNKQSSSSAKIVQSKLYGRDKEIMNIIDFLFAPLCENSSSLLQAYHNMSFDNSSSEQQNNKAMFTFLSASRLLVVNGKEGLGKSALVNSVARALYGTSRQQSSLWNVTVLKNKSSSIHSNAPFHPWVFIMQDLLVKVYRQSCARSSNSVRDTGGLSVDQQMLAAVDYMAPLLTTETQALLPLLSYLNICLYVIPTAGEGEGEGEGEDGSNKSNHVEEGGYNGSHSTRSKRLQKQLQGGRNSYLGALDLLSALFTVFSSISNTLTFIVLEKVQLFDNWSLALLHRLWQSNCGLTILATYCQVDPNNYNNNSISNNSSNNNSKGYGYGLMVSNRSEGAVIAGVSSSSMDNLLQVDDNHSPQRKKSMLNHHSTHSSNSVLLNSSFANTGSGSNDRFFVQYSSVDPSRFAMMDLKVLDKEAIQSLTRETFRTTRANISKSFLDKVYEISGGNPLYAYEIANSVNSSSPVKDSSGGGVGIAADSIITSHNSSLEQLFASASNRIEEVICFRFDQLENHCQLMLKTAAVICSNGSMFTFDMLKSVLMLQVGTNEGSVNELAILEALAELVSREEFVQIAEENNDNDNDHSEEDHQVEEGFNNDDFSIIRMSKLSFRVVLEQLTIYNLLIDAQKEAIHDQVASYYQHQAMVMEKEPSIEALLEEAYHWQRALMWAHALGCYYDAAQRLWELGDYKGYKTQLQLAFRVYFSMRSDVNIMQPLELNGETLPKLLLAAANHNHTSSSSSSLVSPRHSISHINGGDDGNTVLSFDSIHDMCYSESDTLASILRTHLSMAQYQLMTMESPLHTMVVLEEALQLLVLSKAEPEPSLESSKNNNHNNMKKLYHHNAGVPRSISNSSSKANKSTFGHAHFALSCPSNDSDPNGVTSPSGLPPPLTKQMSTRRVLAMNQQRRVNVDSFRLPEFNAIYYPILSACVHIHLWSPTSNPMRYRKAKFICERFAFSAASIEEKEPEHHIQALAQAVGLACRAGKMQEAQQYGEMLTRQYDMTIFSLQLVKRYGMDICSFSFALLGQQLVLSGEIGKGLEYTDLAHENMKGTGGGLLSKHGFSSHLASLPLCASLLFLRRQGEAVELLDLIGQQEETDASSSPLLPSDYRTDLHTILSLQRKLLAGLQSLRLKESADDDEGNDTFDSEGGGVRARERIRSSFINGNDGNGLSSDVGGGTSFPQSLREEEEYAPRRTSYLGHFMYISGLAAEALKIELTLFKQLREMDDNYDEIMATFADKYTNLLVKARSPFFEAFIMSELWPLVSLMTMLRGKETKMPRVPPSLLRAVLELMKRCEKYRYHLAIALLGEFLSVLHVPRKLRAAGQHLKEKAFEAIDKAGDAKKSRLFQQTFHQIVAHHHADSFLLPTATCTPP